MSAGFWLVFHGYGGLSGCCATVRLHGGLVSPGLGVDCWLSGCGVTGWSHGRVVLVGFRLRSWGISVLCDCAVAWRAGAVGVEGWLAGYLAAVRLTRRTADCSHRNERYHQWSWTVAAMMVNAAVSNIRDARLPRTAFADSERGDTPRTREIRGYRGRSKWWQSLRRKPRKPISSKGC